MKKKKARWPPSPASSLRYDSRTVLRKGLVKVYLHLEKRVL